MRSLLVITPHSRTNYRLEGECLFPAEHDSNRIVVSRQRWVTSASLRMETTRRGETHDMSRRAEHITKAYNRGNTTARANETVTVAIPLADQPSVSVVSTQVRSKAKFLLPRFFSLDLHFTGT